MNRLSAAIILLALTLGAGLWGYFSIVSSSEKMIELIEYDCRITTEEKISSSERAEKIQKEWDKKEKIFAVILPHSELDEIEINIKKLTDFNAQNLTEEYLKALNDCANRFEHIIESETPDLKNIF